MGNGDEPDMDEDEFQRGCDMADIAAQREAENNAAITAHIGGKFRHRKTGGEYVVLMFATDEKRMNRVVVYQDTTDAEKVWTRPIWEFQDGRFELVS